jgi:hypothetical protein
MVFGLILIAVGIIAILVKTDVIAGSVWDYTWPTVLVIIGLSIFLGRFLGPRFWWWGWRRHWHDRDRPKPE